MPQIDESPKIQGVQFVRLGASIDTRGRFLEIFRKEWFPGRKWEAVQVNRSDSRRGVLRGLHYHLHQVDYWYPLAGRLRVGMVDLRRGSPTRGGVEVRDLSEDDPVGLFIPSGVAHGFLALTDVVLTYVVDGYYDPEDEHGVAWSDPDLGVSWGAMTPILSERDRQNPLLKDIPENRRPE